MHDAAFAEAAVQSPAYILKRPLRPYSVGHELFLQGRRNALVGGDLAAIRPFHIWEAVLICEHSWREIRHLGMDPLIGLKFRIWGWRARKESLEVAIADFINYRRAGSSFPPTDPPDSSGREAGSPVMARLIQFLIAYLGKTEEQAHDYPFGLANWHFATWLETQGTLKILNEAELDFEKFCREQEEQRIAKAKEAPCRP